MDYEQEIERLTLLLDAERSTTRRLKELLIKSKRDKERCELMIEILQEELEEFI